MRQAGIYKIQSISHPERIYIGSALYLKGRWGNHLCELRQGKHHSSKLQHHYDKYGEKDLIFTPICLCGKNDLTPDENGIIWTEQCFIWAYHYKDDIKPWLNVSPLAGSSLGIKRTEEFKEKERKAITGIKRTLEHNLKISKSQTGAGNSMYGRPPWNKGKKGLQSMNKEQRERIGDGSRRAWERRKLKKVA